MFCFSSFVVEQYRKSFLELGVMRIGLRALAIEVVSARGVVVRCAEMNMCVRETNVVKS